MRISITLTTMLFSGACVVSDKESAATDTSSLAQAPSASATPIPMDTPGAQRDSLTPVSDMRIEVDLTARKLRVYKGQDSVGAYPVAIGSAKWPTQPGDWKITQVIWNPEWTPPDESWAEEREPRKPGDPKNPLGRTQLVYDPPRSIHGTSDPSSIGKAVSHGSIRMRNADIARLGRQLMESAGVSRDSAFFQNVKSNRTEKVVVDLPGGVPIKVL